jgi:hypothetical protein
VGLFFGGRRRVCGLGEEDRKDQRHDDGGANPQLNDGSIKGLSWLLCSQCHGGADGQNVSHRSDDAYDEEVLKLEHTVGVAGDNGAKNLQDDDDEQDVIDGLNHPHGKERPRGEDTDDTKNEGHNGNAEKEYAQHDMEDVFHTFGPLGGHNAFR